MSATPAPPSPTSGAASRRNGFGALRLLLALLVILSHAPEMADGDRHCEILTRIFGTLSFGDLAVDGFFIISGYLISASMLSNSPGFMSRRILRIYPGFLVASAICLFIVGPLAGADLGSMSLRSWGMAIVHLALLRPPQLDGVFAGSHYAALNGSMWTIRFEFGCYLLTWLLGRTGLLQRPRVLVAITALLALTHIWAQGHPLPHAPKSVISLLGEPANLVRLGLAYMAGTCLRVLAPPLRSDVALLAGLLLIPAMRSHALAEPALILLGGYGLIWLALRVRHRLFLTINAREDISYGVYLYAFPIGKLLFQSAPGMNIWLNALITACLAIVAGWISWKLVEQPAMRMGRPRVASPAHTAPVPTHSIPG